MKHLYIIGNGFDIFTGIKSSYADFKKWLQRKYPFIYENLCDTYEIEGEWWNDFEINLGKLDIFSYIDKFIHKLVAYKCYKCGQWHVGRSKASLTPKKIEKIKNS